MTGFQYCIESICANVSRASREPLVGRPHEWTTRVISVLSSLLLAEKTCAERYALEAEIAAARHGEDAAKDFACCALEEQRHADRLALRMAELCAGLGSPSLSEGCGEIDVEDVSVSAERDAKQVRECLEEMVQVDAQAERMMITAYGDAIGWVAPRDPKTADLLREILEDERAHVLS